MFAHESSPVPRERKRLIIAALALLGLTAMVLGTQQVAVKFEDFGRRNRALSPQSLRFSVREGQTVNEIVTRAELFAALQALAEVVPEMRGGQLIAAVGELCADLHGRGLWDAADAELLEAVWQFRRDFEAATVPQNGALAGASAAADRPRE
jgi:hypothetical protein